MSGFRGKVKFRSPTATERVWLGLQEEKRREVLVHLLSIRLQVGSGSALRTHIHLTPCYCHMADDYTYTWCRPCELVQCKDGDWWCKLEQIYTMWEQEGAQEGTVAANENEN